MGRGFEDDSLTCFGWVTLDIHKSEFQNLGIWQHGCGKYIIWEDRGTATAKSIGQAGHNRPSQATGATVPNPSMTHLVEVDAGPDLGWTLLTFKHEEDASRNEAAAAYYCNTKGCNQSTCNVDCPTRDLCSSNALA